MEVSTKNLMVYPDQCSSDECSNCFSSHCQLCLKCLSEEAIDYLKASYIEHNNRQDCRRIFPPRNVSLALNKIDELESLCQKPMLKFNDEFAHKFSLLHIHKLKRRNQKIYNTGCRIGK